MDGRTGLFGWVAVAALAACAPSRDPRVEVAGHLAMAAEARTSALGCASELEALVAASPEAAWSALEPERALPDGPLGGDGERDRLARRDREEIRRRLRSVESIQRAVARLAEGTALQTHLDLGNLAQEGRSLSLRLCRARDGAVAAVARSGSPVRSRPVPGHDQLAHLPE